MHARGGRPRGRGSLTHTIELSPQGDAALSVDEAQCDSLAEDLRLLVGESAIAEALEVAEGSPARLLHSALRSAPVVHSLERILEERRRLSLNELTTELWRSDSDAAIRATTHLLQLTAAAKTSIADYPLVPHRVHFLAQTPGGLSVCLSEQCTGTSGLSLPGLGSVSAGVQDRCPSCGSAALALARCGNCGEYGLAAVKDVAQGVLRPAAFRSADKHFYSTRSDAVGPNLTIDPASAAYGGAGAHPLSLTRVDECPNCHAATGDAWGTFGAPDALATSILAETIVSQVPEYAASPQTLAPRARTPSPCLQRQPPGSSSAWPPPHSPARVPGPSCRDGRNHGESAGS